MQIIPADGHVYLSAEKEELFDTDGPAAHYNSPEKFTLGTKDRTLWGKKFKIRLTSKKTGRKIDINLGFKNLHIPNEPE